MKSKAIGYGYQLKRAVESGEIVDRLKWYFHRRTPQIEAAGTTADVPAESYNSYRAADLFLERELVGGFIEEMDSDAVFWDVGANIGLWSLLVGQHARETVAFEPDGRIRPHLRRHLQHNAIMADVQPYGLADSKRTEQLRMNDRWGREDIELQIRRADQLIQEGRVPAPDAMKIDVEGFEGQVIDGLGDYLNSVSLIQIETHPGKMAGAWTVESLLEHLQRTHSVETAAELSGRKYLRARYIG